MNLRIDCRHLPEIVNILQILLTTQNDILLAACDTILGQISAEVQQAGVFAIMADECRDVSRIEQLSVCIRYVNNGVVTERFLGFSDMHELDASAITDEIASVLGKQGINVKQCIAQCYDGASVMSGRRSGVQARFREIVGSGCIYIHCYAHRLNLVVVDLLHSWLYTLSSMFHPLQLHICLPISNRLHNRLYI